MQTTNQKVLITGATAGIGLALTKRFLSEGNTVIGIGRNPKILKELKGSILPFQADLSKISDRFRLLDYINNEHEDLSVLINNAGIQYNYSFLEEGSKIDKINYELELNLTAPLHLCEAIIPLFLQSESEKAIINVTSGLADVPKSSAPVYCGSKAGLKQFSKALKWQLTDSNIRVFDLSPSLVDTGMTAGRGKGKITPDKLVDEFWNKYKKNRYHIDIGKVKLLKVLNRLSPSLAESIMKKN